MVSFFLLLFIILLLLPRNSMLVVISLLLSFAIFCEISLSANGVSNTIGTEFDVMRCCLLGNGGVQDSLSHPGAHPQPRRFSQGHLCPWKYTSPSPRARMTQASRSVRGDLDNSLPSKKTCGNCVGSDMLSPSVVMQNAGWHPGKGVHYLSIDFATLKHPNLHTFALFLNFLNWIVFFSVGLISKNVLIISVDRLFQRETPRFPWFLSMECSREGDMLLGILFSIVRELQRGLANSETFGQMFRKWLFTLYWKDEHEDDGGARGVFVSCVCGAWIFICVDICVDICV